MDGAGEAGDPIATLPVLYHLLWRQELAADLTLVLSHRTIVRRTISLPKPPPGRR
jgi:hypothetical protein